jgi:MFS superfamily sulfate permease-like transporter
MIQGQQTGLTFSQAKYDIPASIVVFLVAMPLCLGIALASGAPLFSGLIAGIVGGIVVGAFSGSPLGVSGPAAGLAVIVLNAINSLGSYEVFLMSVVIAGAIQIIMGFAKAGIIAYYFPSSVINGMLSAIGIIIFLKQVPHFFGWDAVPEGHLGFQQPDNENTFSEILNIFDHVSTGPTIIGAVSLGILLLWQTKLMSQYKVFQLVQGPLVAVVVGILLTLGFQGNEALGLDAKQLVSIPVSASLSEFFGNFTMPSFGAALRGDVIMTAVVLAVVGSLETLLCVEASDKQDPYKRVTPTNRELKAQGIGNIISGLIGGLPITQVIVRSSVNAQAGGRTKLSAIVHGFIILTTIIAIPSILNLIPLATLAAILFVVGYKLAKPALFKKIYAQGHGQFVPFIATIAGIVFTDLLMGIGIGLVVSIFFILHKNMVIPIVVDESCNHITIELSENVSFLKKAAILKFLAEIPNGKELTIDASKNHYIHHDVIDIIEDFQISAKNRDIKVNLIELYEHKQQDPIIHVKSA